MKSLILFFSTISRTFLKTNTLHIPKEYYYCLKRYRIIAENEKKTYVKILFPHPIYGEADGYIYHYPKTLIKESYCQIKIKDVNIQDYFLDLKIGEPIAGIIKKNDDGIQIRFFDKTVNRRIIFYLLRSISKEIEELQE